MPLDRPAVRLRLTAHGPRPADDVWDRYLRPARWPEWSPQIRSVRYPFPALRPRTEGVVLGPAGLRVHFRVLDVDRAGPVRAWSWSVSAAGVRLRLRHTVGATATGARTGLELHGFAPAALLYLPAARIALRRLVR